MQMLWFELVAVRFGGWWAVARERGEGEAPARGGRRPAGGHALQHTHTHTRKHTQRAYTHAHTHARANTHTHTHICRERCIRQHIDTNARGGKYTPLGSTALANNAHVHVRPEHVIITPLIALALMIINAEFNHWAGSILLNATYSQSVLSDSKRPTLPGPSLCNHQACICASS